MKKMMLVVCLGIVSVVRACDDHCHEERVRYGVRVVSWQGPGEATCSPVNFFPTDDAGRERYAAFIKKFPHYGKDPLAFIDYSGLLHFYEVCKQLANEEQAFIDNNDDKREALDLLRGQHRSPSTCSRRALNKVRYEITYELYARIYLQTHAYTVAALQGSSLPVALRNKYLASSQKHENRLKAIQTSDN